MYPLRTYQRKVIDKVFEYFNSGESEVAVAVAPSGGKTEIIKHIIHENPNSSFLIITHGTTVLKNHWERELKASGIKYSQNIGEERVCCNLPQSLHRKELIPVDYLVVDEAHEFTYAEMMTTIKDKVKPKKIIFLTGTPSVFIAKKIKVVCVSAELLIREGHSSDVYIGLFSTTAQIDDSDYNNEGDLRSNFEYKLENSVDEDMDQLLIAMHKRLTETHAVKSSPNFRKKIEWLPTIGAFHKTLVACKSIDQSRKVVKYFEKSGVGVISSDSENDVDSSNIKKFETNPELKVLVVVNRGILGFNMPDLVNVVDLTGSRNINRIYQLYARVMRKHPDHEMKYFFKISSEESMLLNKFYVNAALLLMFEEFILQYNGTNLKNMRIPVHKKTIIGTANERETTRSRGGLLEKIVPLDDHFMFAVKACSFLRDIQNNIGNPANEYAYVTFGEMMENNCGIRYVLDAEFFKTLPKELRRNLSVIAYNENLRLEEAYQKYKDSIDKEVKKVSESSLKLVS